MNEEIKRALEELRASLGKNTDALVRVDAIEAAGKKADADVKLIRAEIDQVKTVVEERNAQIVELQRQARVQAVERDPITDKRKALEMTGMLVRSVMARARGITEADMPAEFRKETELVRGYHQECLQRATLTPMSGTGSYVIPTVTDATIQSAVEEVSEIMGLVDMTSNLPAGGTFKFTFLSSRPTAQKARAGTDTTRTASDPVFSQLSLSPKEKYVTFPMDNAFFLMSPIGLGGEFQKLCTEAVIDKLVYLMLLGDGTAGDDLVLGALNETEAAYIVAMANGKSAFADLEKSHLTNLKAKCFKRGRGARGRFVMDFDILGKCEDMDRTGKTPVVTYGPDGSPRVLGNEVVVEEKMPGIAETAASTGFMLFGDLATIKVAMVGGIRIGSDASVGFKENQTWFKGETIVDLKRKPVQTLELLKTGAAQA